jgi:ABC-type antimicrobial peptide transport system permease subunit
MDNLSKEFICLIGFMTGIIIGLGLLYFLIESIKSKQKQIEKLEKKEEKDK